jgi:hypothetical protein
MHIRSLLSQFIHLNFQFTYFINAQKCDQEHFKFALTGSFVSARFHCTCCVTVSGNLDDPYLNTLCYCSVKITVSPDRPFLLHEAISQSNIFLNLSLLCLSGTFSTLIGNYYNKPAF